MKMNICAIHKKYSFDAISRYRTEIMGFAALWIWIFHEWELILHSVPVLSYAESFIQKVGFCGVDIFFLLSGMGLTYASGKYPLRTFYKKRLQRVLPPFILIVAVYSICNGESWLTFLMRISGYSFLMGNMNTILWFVPAIIILYLLFPIYYRLFLSSKRKNLFTAAVILIWLVASVLLDGTLRIDLYGFTNRIPVFVTGILFGWTIQNKTLQFSIGRWIICCAVFAAGVSFAYTTNFRGMYLLVPLSNCCLPNYLLTVSGCALLSKLFYLLDNHCCKLYDLVKKFLNFFGTRSLEFYCVQEMVGGIAHKFLYQRFGSVLGNISNFLCAVLAAEIIYRICRFFLRLLESGLPKHTAS